MLERDIEKYLTMQVKRYDGLSFKWVSPGNAGVPDRIVIIPTGRVWFIEMKRPGEKLKKLQAWVSRILRAAGCNVTALYSREDVDAWLKEVMTDGVHTAQVPAKGD